jgi:excisionase family DNA binding protein
MSGKSRSVAALPANAPVSSTPEPILTIEEVAARLKLKPPTVYELTRKRNRRRLPSMKAGKVLRFFWSDVERWLREGAAA